MNTFAIVLKGQEVSYIPENWIVRADDGSQIVLWPKQKISEYVNIADSMPVIDGPNKWRKMGNYSILKKGIKTLKQAKKKYEKLIEGEDLKAAIDTDDTTSNQSESEQEQSNSMQVTFQRRLSTKDTISTIPTFTEFPLNMAAPQTKGSIKFMAPENPTELTHSNDEMSTESDDSNEDLRDYMSKKNENESSDLNLNEDFIQLDNAHIGNLVSRCFFWIQL